MTERKIELPLLGWQAAQQACEGSYQMANEEREAQLLAALAKIADMEALLRDLYGVLKDVEWAGEDISCPQCSTDITCGHKPNCTLCNAMKRVDALLAEGL